MPHIAGSAAISNTSKAGSSYGWAARRAATTAARAARGSTVSNRVSATVSIAPTEPMAGFAPGNGRNVPVPGALNAHRS